ncbi:hypothetical protein C8R47DRAFT_1121392 [Mycena vitilis]|nr:hypothetical protein C8R47DRAFT_1121392 [Mycena vitilis]
MRFFARSDSMPRLYRASARALRLSRAFSCLLSLIAKAIACVRFRMAAECLELVLDGNIMLFPKVSCTIIYASAMEEEERQGLAFATRLMCCICRLGCAHRDVCNPQIQSRITEIPGTHMPLASDFTSSCIPV